MTQRTRGRILQRIRDFHFAAQPWCVACLAKGVKELATELDHVIPLFKGGVDDDSNRQGLCSACHEAKTREDMGYSESGACDASGLPLSPSHPWNRGGGRGLS